MQMCRSRRTDECITSVQSVVPRTADRRAGFYQNPDIPLLLPSRCSARSQIRRPCSDRSWRCMSALATSAAALRALRSMQLLLSGCPPLPGACACGARTIQLRAFSADVARPLAREEAAGSTEIANRNARVFSQVRERMSATPPSAILAHAWLDSAAVCVFLTFSKSTLRPNCRIASPATESWSQYACRRRRQAENGSGRRMCR